MCNSLRVGVLVLALVIGLTVTAIACQVPVFRYALERWESDRYTVIVLTDGNIDASAKVSLDQLELAAGERGANLDVQTVDVAAVRDQRLLQLWSDHQPSQAPLMVVLYPRTASQVPDRVIEANELSTASVERLLHSPVRQEVARRLSDGQSAVWIFVPCGDELKDKTAFDNLSQRIAANQQKLTVPTAEELDIEPERLANNKIPLRIEFSVVRLERLDTREAFLLGSLSNSEADLPADEPWAFPVFGRGRVLYGLVGAGIMPETLDTACKFMAGPCSCQVKNQNPGFDLLLAHPWEQSVAGSLISDALPDESAEPRLLQIPPGRK